MKAIVMTAAGAPEVLQLQDVAEPIITRPTQIKVRLKAAGINPIDTKVRARGLFYGAQPPAILGCDGAGEVVEIGSAVRRFQVGDSVWFCHGGLGREPGNYAEYTVLEETEAEFKPGTADWPEAAAAPLVLITAWEALFDRGGLEEGQSVLIHAGAGGVGHVAIQLAKARGADVITTVSNDAKAAFVRALGADAVINYREQDLVAEVMRLTEGRGVDLAFDTVGPAVFEQTIPAVAHYGTLVTILEPSGVALSEARMRNLTIAFTLMLTPMLRDLAEAREHHGEILRVCGEWMDADRLKLHVSERFPLAEAAAAHRLIGQGHVQGKLILEP
jgi:NADPH2:quinone reductase